MRTFAILLITLAWLAACSNVAVPGTPQQGDRNPALQGKDPDEAAKKSLEAFRGLVTDQNFKALGFESRDEVAAAQLAEPLRVSLVPLDQLQKYERGSDPQRLLIEANRIIYPVTVKDQVRSSISVTKVDDGWQGANFGSAVLVKLLTGARKAKSDFVVSAPAMNAYFLASRADNRLLLTPILDDPNLGFKAGGTLPAEEAFAVLARAAQGINGLPN